MAYVKTENQRKKSRAASHRRRRKQNLYTALGLLILLAAIILWICLANRKKPEPDASVSDSSVIPTVTTASSAASSTTETEPGETTDPTESDTQPAATTTTRRTEGHYVQPAGAAWNLRLVNDWNEMEQEYVESIPLETFAYNTYWEFDSRALPYLYRMIDDANAAGCSLWGQSLFRSYNGQYKLYWAQVNELLYQGYGQEEAERVAATIVKRPGQSEHNTGLALDFECSEFPDLEEGFKDTYAYEWLTAHCAEYGFILRFPKDKEDITGVIYEPWHYRYVGVEAATEIMARGLCLEEYLEEKGL